MKSPLQLDIDPNTKEIHMKINSGWALQLEVVSDKIEESVSESKPKGERVIPYNENNKNTHKKFNPMVKITNTFRGLVKNYVDLRTTKHLSELTGYSKSNIYLIIYGKKKKIHKDNYDAINDVVRNYFKDQYFKENDTHNNDYNVASYIDETTKNDTGYEIDGKRIRLNDDDFNIENESDKIIFANTQETKDHQITL